MSYFGYIFLAKTPELIVQRRILLDRYANLAQISQLMVHLSIMFCKNVASSSVGSYATDSQKSNVVVMARIAGILKYRLSAEVSRGYGTYGQWIFGLVWTAWLVFLCIAETTPDYLHLTKRFGLIAASQLPIHYLLSMSQSSSPLELLARKSHRLNMSLHHVTGKIIIIFFAIHIFLYSSFLVQMDMLRESIRHLNIAVGITSAVILFTLGITSSGPFRRRRYWCFYKIHVTGSVIILPLLFFHVIYIRIYLVESAMVLVIIAAFRIFSSQR